MDHRKNQGTQSVETAPDHPNSDGSFTIKALKEQLEEYRLIFDSIHNGVMVTDADGYVTHFNKPYGQFLGLDPATQIGRHCTDVIENTRMHIVAKTGKPEINQSHLIKDQNMVVQRIPIWQNGKVIAVFGQVMFKNIKDVSKLANQLSLLESKVKLYEEELITLRSTRYTFDSIIGQSPAITSLKKEALNAAANQFPLLITGDSGTGKELFAQAIHHASPRKLYPFVRINCSAIPKDLLESELFGYEKGAFTGARTEGKPGKFEIAHQGTVFLDEIGDLPLEMQPKLLRAVEEKEFERVGGTRIIRSDFRVIAATNQNLEEMMSDGRFRKDLYYRLNVIPLNIPPLRERRDDIDPLTRYFMQQMAQEAAISEIRIGPEAKKALNRYDWPGNVRELVNVLERTLSALEGNRIQLSDLPFYLQRTPAKSSQQNQTSIRGVHARAEKEVILYALEETNHNKARAAKMLGIHRTHLYKKMKKYRISLDKDSQ
ncbi:sensory box sigma-54 dependent DNA-binding response regulator [Olavius algarvensis Delta 1 endosymbiont]|nr:sensory box sigma-54 dependent DNA-binding response regulator [Olavius algarvensis Delta 1 endosymbiont]